MLANLAVRLVVLFTSFSITNLLIALLKWNKTERRAYHLDEIHRIQHAIIDRLAEQFVIREKIDRMINNIAMFAEAAWIGDLLCTDR